MIENRLLETAIVQFGRLGLEGASTRAIAASAGTAMSSITYHYGSKKGLYIAAAEYIAAQMSERLEPLAAGIPKEDAAITSAEAADHLGRILDGIARLLLSQESANWSLYIVREQMQPTEAFDRLYDGPMSRMMGLLVRLIGAASGIADARERRLLALSLFGQALVFRAARTTVLRTLAVDSLDETMAAAIRARLQHNLQAILAAARKGEA